MKTPDIRSPNPELPDDALLASYFADEPDAVTEAAILTWVGNSVSRRTTLERLRMGWEGSGRPPVRGNLADFTRALHERITAEEPRNRQVIGSTVTRGFEAHAPQSPVLRSRRSSFARAPWTARLGLGVLAVVAIAFIAQWVTRSTNETSSVQRYATGMGERTNLMLPDGSRVVLAPRSRLEYRTGENGSRYVTLSGQAHFTVTHDARRSFTVRSGTVQTRVLGTAFDVRHYPSDLTVRIVVADGKVAARGRRGLGAPVLLVAGTEGQLTDSTAMIVTNRNTDDAEAWTRGRLKFDEIPVSEMLRTLERWYGYEFRLADSALARRHVTAGFAIGDTVNTMLDLKVLLGVTLRFDGSVVTLVPVRKRPKGVPSLHRFLVFPSQSEVGK